MNDIAKITSFILFLFYNQYIFSQNNYFEGNLLLKDNKTTPYILDINIDSLYHVYGYSEIGISPKTRYAIEGHFDPKTNFIFYKEQNFENSKINCPIYVQARISHLIQDIYVIAGLFISQDSNRCGNGHINVINHNFKFNPISSHPTTIENDSLNQIALQDILHKNIDAEKKYIDVTASDHVDIYLSQPQFTLKIYDLLKIDRDKVRIIFNKKVVSELELTAELKEFYLQANKGANTLEIIALNEGTIPTNTSKLEIISRTKTEYFTNLLYKSQKSTYTIFYE